MFGFGMFLDDPLPYNTAYRCFPISMLPGSSKDTKAENGGKIMLPQSALNYLTRLDVGFPMLFKLTNHLAKRVTHCGVLEFVADEGSCYIPKWMMVNLGLTEGGVVQVESIVLPVGNFSKFEPQSIEFLDITNPRAILENALRSFACLTMDDMIVIKYNNKLYELKVLETKPENAISIIECDLDVEFTRPANYIESENQKKNEDEASEKSTETYNQPGSFTPFSGTRYRLDGKSVDTVSPPPTAVVKRGIPDYDTYKNVFNLKFWRDYKKPEPKKGPEPKKELIPFSGEGHTLKSNDKDN